MLHPVRASGLIAGLVVVACSSSVVVVPEQGAGGAGGSPSSTGSIMNSSSKASVSSSSKVSSSTGPSPDCGGFRFADPTCDDCALGACCNEMQNCTAGSE